VPPERCELIAEDLLQAKLVCPLGGKYEPKPEDPRPTNFLSTALRSGAARADYQLPALNWLRGAQFDVLMQDARLAAHANLLMPLSTRDKAPLGKQPPAPVQAIKPAPRKAQASAEPPKAEKSDATEREELPPPRRTPPPPPVPSPGRSSRAK